METLLASANIQTRCPNCQTVFEIGQDIVQGDDPRVRCGECFSIFNSKENMLLNALPDDLLVDGSMGSDSSVSQSTAEVDLNDEKIFFQPDNNEDVVNDFTDMDLFSDQAVLPEVEYLQDSDDIPELDFDTMDPDGDQFDGTLFDDVNLDDDEPRFDDTGVWPSEPLNDTNIEVEEDLVRKLESDFRNESTPQTREDLSLEPGSIPVMDVDPADFSADHYDPALHAPEQAKGSGHFGIRLFLLLVLLAGLGGLYVYSNWQSLQNTEAFATVKCYFEDCSSAQTGDLEQLRVVRRNVYSHPKVDKALVINIVFRNNAKFAQVYPILGIQMSDIRGEVVAMRDFKPFEYLKKSIKDEIPLIEAGQMVDVSLEVNDPGDDAKSFELEFK